MTRLRRAQRWFASRDLGLLIGRVLVVLVLLQGGWLKLAYPGGAAQYLQQLGMPLAGVPLAVAAGLVESLGALAILIGWRARAAAVMLVVYLVPMTWWTHIAVAHGTPDQLVKDQETLQALKNFSVIGGLLLLRAVGPGRHSLDGK